MITVTNFDLRQVWLQTRMPFRYGIATMTRVPHLFAIIELDMDGMRACGVSADLLPPKWFSKNPDAPVEAEIAEMLEVIRHAFQTAAGLKGSTGFDLWWSLYQHQEQWGRSRGLPPLLVHFGTSVVERAMIDAVCRGAKVSFARMLRENRFGIDLGRVHGELSGKAPSDFLPERPLQKIMVRHTVGLADPLRCEDVPAEERLADGLPQSLAACIEVYGLRHFKIKVTGDLETDAARLSDAARVIGRYAPRDYAFSLDGNEQFKSMEDFREYWADLANRLPEFFNHLLFVEQPVHRAMALDAEVEPAFRNWPGHPPMIIDESDGAIADASRALRLGYSGTSHKNCKGVFKGVANFCLIRHRSNREPGRPWLMSGEDLCNVGPVALLQDLAAMAAMGIYSVERNGHHYHAGLSQFPAAVQEEVLRHHPDLYRRSPAGWPTLSISEGEARVGTVNSAPFGVESVPDLEFYEQV